MKSVTRRDIAIQVSRSTNLSLLDVEAVVKETVEAIRNTIASGKTVQFRFFGTFEFRERLQRVKVNPKNTSEELLVPAHFVVLFTPASGLKAAVLRLKEVTATQRTFAGRKRAKKSINTAPPESLNGVEQ